jgi:hypothetical protein
MPDVDVQQKVQELEKELAVVATKAGQASTAGASIAGLAASVVTGGVALIVGIFLGLAIRQAELRRRR